MPPPTIHTEFDDRSRLVTTPIGELDAVGAEALRRHLDDLPFPPDVVDARFVGLATAAAIGQLVRLHASGAVEIVPSDPLLRVVQVCGLDHELRLSPAAARPALDHATTPIVVLDDRLRVGYADRAFWDVVGRPDPVVAGPCVIDRLSRLVPGFATTALDTVMTDGESISPVGRAHGRDGRPLQLTYRAARHSGRRFVVVEIGSAAEAPVDPWEGDALGIPHW